MSTITTIVFLLLLPSQDADVLQRLDQADEHYHLGYYQVAYQAYADLLENDRTKRPAILGMAACQLQWGEYEASIKTLESLPEQDRHGEWHRQMADAMSKLGHYHQAIEHGQSGLGLAAQDLRIRYELGHMLESVGRFDEAIEAYQPFNDIMHDSLPESAQDMHYAGLGFYRYSVLTRSEHLTSRTKHVLQEVLQKACEQVDLTYWPARLSMAQLLSEKDNVAEAYEDFKRVLALNPHCLEAHLGLAAMALNAWAFEAVEQRVAVCLDLNPNSCEALLILASLRMVERRHVDAIKICKKALAINPRHLEVLSLLAAAQLLNGEYDHARDTQQLVYDIVPRPAVLHATLGKQLADARQFPEAEAEFLKAIEFSPTSAMPRNELAMMYMQWGFEDRAREVIEEALDLDGYNSRTFNTWRLLKELSSFKRHVTENFEIHFDANHDAIIGEYFGHYLESIYDELCDDYEVELEHKTIIEVFPDHRKFGVRIHGKPWIHTVGACTGRVIAMDAPRADVRGPYNFANVLRHEFTHTVTLACTNNRIPHWFTEGLAVLQEDRPKSWTWRVLLSDAIRTNSLFDLESINWGFIRPRKADDRQMAYAQSEWMCEYLIERFGYDVINDMLRRFKQGQVQATVFPAVTGMDTKTFDAEFRAWARTEAAQWGTPLTPPVDVDALPWLLRFYPNSAPLTAELALHFLEQNELDQARPQVEKALTLGPTNTLALLAGARYHLASAAAQRTKEDYLDALESAARQYQALHSVDGENAEAIEFLAEWHLQNKDAESATTWAKRLKRVQPLNPASYRLLGTIYLETEDDDMALPELLEFARHNEHDPVVPRQIANIYAAQEKHRAAAAWYRDAINIDPYDVETHQAYGRVLTKLSRHQDAIREYRILTMIEPDEARHMTELAFAYLRAGDQDQARATAAKAIELDPRSPAQQLLQ